MCMFRLIRDPDGDFSLPARAVRHSSSHSRPSSSHHQRRSDNRTARPSYGIPMIVDPRGDSAYYEVTPRPSYNMPRSGLNYVDVAPGHSSGHYTAAPVTFPRDYDEVAPGRYGSVVRPDAISLPSPEPVRLIPAPSPRLPIPPASSPIPIRELHTAAAPAGEVPPEAPEPPPADRPRRVYQPTARTEPAISRSASPPRTQHLRLEVPQTHRHSSDQGEQRRGHRRTTSDQSHGHSSTQSRSQRSGSSRRSENHSSPPTSPRSGTSGNRSKRNSRLLEDQPNRGPVTFRRVDDRRDDRRERVETMVDGRRVPRDRYS